MKYIVILKKKLRNWGVDRNIWKKTQHHGQNLSVLCGSCRLKNNCASFSGASAAGRTPDDGCKEIDQIQLTP